LVFEFLHLKWVVYVLSHNLSNILKCKLTICWKAVMFIQLNVLKCRKKNKNRWVCSEFFIHFTFQTSVKLISIAPLYKCNMITIIKAPHNPVRNIIFDLCSMLFTHYILFYLYMILLLDFKTTFYDLLHLMIFWFDCMYL
jgi:hypothetical protein